MITLAPSNDLKQQHELKAWHATIMCEYRLFLLASIYSNISLTGVHLLEVDASLLLVPGLGLKPEENDNLGSMESLFFS